MNALDNLMNKSEENTTDLEFAIIVLNEVRPNEAENAAEELAAMRQLISEQMERIQQQQAIVDATKELDEQCGWITTDLIDDHEYEVQGHLLKKLATALAALPQPATKGKP
jgi:hypothetical protein